MAAIAGLRRLPLPLPPSTAGAARRSTAARQRLHSLPTCRLAVRTESAAQRGGPRRQTERGCTRVFASGVSVLKEPAKTPEPEVSGDALGEDFSWTQRWYPVGPEDDMDRTAPYPFEVIGRLLLRTYLYCLHQSLLVQRDFSPHAACNVATRKRAPSCPPVDSARERTWHVNFPVGRGKHCVLTGLEET